MEDSLELYLVERATYTGQMETEEVPQVQQAIRTLFSHWDWLVKDMITVKMEEEWSMVCLQAAVLLPPRGYLAQTV